MKPREARIHVHKESHHFSAGHFTIFSKSDRENLHGHNYRVTASIHARIGENGLCFDYNALKAAMQTICDALDETFLLPGRSPFLKIQNEGTRFKVSFGEEELTFLKRDVTIISVRNVTIEELAEWFLHRLSEDKRVKELPMELLELSVSSGPSEHASAQWRPS